MKYITKKWLEKNGACGDGKDWYGNRRLTVRQLSDALTNEEHYDWANWVITHVLDKRDNVRYALFAARQCERLSKDPRVKQCNDTVQAWLTGTATIEQVRSAQSAARSAAQSAAESAIWSAAGSAESAAESARWSAEWSAEWSAQSAAWSAAQSAARAAAWSAGAAAWKLIIAEGLRIYEEVK